VIIDEAGWAASDGRRPGEGTRVGVLRLPSGRTIDVPRYAGAASPLVGFEGDLKYPAMWAGESIEVVNELLPAAEIVRMLAADALVHCSRESEAPNHADALLGASRRPDRCHRVANSLFAGR